MSIRLFASRASWLFYCAVIATAVSGEDAPTPSPRPVTIETWVAEVSLVRPNAVAIGHKTIGKIFAMPAGQPLGKIQRLEDLGASVPVDQIVSDLESKKLARVLTAAKLTLNDAESGSVTVGTATIEAKATVRGGKLVLNYKYERNEPMAGGVNRQLSVDTAIGGIESGKAFVLPLFHPMADATKETLAVFLVATFDASQQASDDEVPDQSAPSATEPPRKPLAIHLKVAQVNAAKIKRLGFTWSQLTPDGEKRLSGGELVAAMKNGAIQADQFNELLAALERKGLARLMVEPVLITLDGRSATFTAGSTSVDFIPVLLPSGGVMLQRHVKDGDSQEMTFANKMELGKSCLLGELNVAALRFDPHSPEVETVVLARVEECSSGGLIVSPTADTENRELTRRILPSPRGNRYAPATTRRLTR